MSNSYLHNKKKVLFYDIKLIIYNTTKKTYSVNSKKNDYCITKHLTFKFKVTTFSMTAWTLPLLHNNATTYDQFSHRGSIISRNVIDEKEKISCLNFFSVIFIYAFINFTTGLIHLIYTQEVKLPSNWFKSCFESISINLELILCVL